MKLADISLNLFSFEKSWILPREILKKKIDGGSSYAYIIYVLIYGLN